MEKETREVVYERTFNHSINKDDQYILRIIHCSTKSRPLYYRFSSVRIKNGKIIPQFTRSSDRKRTVIRDFLICKDYAKSWANEKR